MKDASSEAAPTTFAVVGMIDRDSIDTINAAVRAVDPTANVKVSLATGLVSVRSAATAELIQRAIETQGFIAE
jgi:copper chaperone CopZ